MGKTLRIVADRNIPFVREAIESLGETLYLPGDAITPEVMRGTDILLTRTRTRCDSSLLAGSPCTFIGTATIGTDHIDLPYCQSQGITVANAPGCNAPAVAQYVLAAIASTLKPDETLSEKTIGIIGAGNVGSILERWARGLGMKVMLNDPPLQEKGTDGREFVSLDEIARNCDVITVHTPLTREGDHPTYHLIDEAFLAGTTRRTMIINAARGPVTDTSALKNALCDGRISAVAIDCWEGEPTIDTELLALATVATPHIAGYSQEGKIRATSMVLDALAPHLSSRYGLDITAEKLKASLPAVHPVPRTIREEDIDYDIKADTATLKSVPADKLPATFESLRNNYNLRLEPHSDL